MKISQSEFRTGSGTATSTAQPLAPSQRANMAVQIKAGGPVFIGDSAHQHYALAAGEEVFVEVCDPSKIWIKSQSGTQPYSWVVV